MEKILAVDFDGVIHGYQSGWQGPQATDDPPVPGVRPFLEEMSNDYRIVIHSTRAETKAGVIAIYNYLREHHLYFDEITHLKPPARVYLDDRAMLFTGSFDGLPEKIRKFRTWHNAI